MKFFAFAKDKVMDWWFHVIHVKTGFIMVVLELLKGKNQKHGFAQIVKTMLKKRKRSINLIIFILFGN